MDSNLSPRFDSKRRRARRWMIAAAIVSGLAGCSITSTREAPVAERSTPPAKSPPPVVVAKPAPPRAPAADGNYRVQPGDTLFSIAAAFGADVKDLARWNSLEDPSRIRVGQLLRVVPPNSETAAALPVTPTSPATTRPLEGSAAAPAAGTPAPAAEAATTPGPVASITEARPPAAAASSDWIWPASGRVIEKFDGKRNKGIGIGGKEGDPVVASADGTVTYTGNGLRGYGNLVILRHGDEFISAYAHNRQVFVKHCQTVKRGQRIAEIGNSEATKPMLHFEIRRNQNGQFTAVDPLDYLPPR